MSTLTWHCCSNSRIQTIIITSIPFQITWKFSWTDEKITLGTGFLKIANIILVLSLDIYPPISISSDLLFVLRHNLTPSLMLAWNSLQNQIGVELKILQLQPSKELVLQACASVPNLFILNLLGMDVCAFFSQWGLLWLPNEPMSGHKGHRHKQCQEDRVFFLRCYGRAQVSRHRRQLWFVHYQTVTIACSNHRKTPQGSPRHHPYQLLLYLAKLSQARLVCKVSSVQEQSSFLGGASGEVWPGALFCVRSYSETAQHNLLPPNFPGLPLPAQ